MRARSTRSGSRAARSSFASGAMAPTWSVARSGPRCRRTSSPTSSLDSEEQIFTISLDEALTLLAAPKTRRGRGAPRGPLRELGADPSSGRPVVVREGRFGPYVTDGETNASLRGGDSPESLTLD